MKNDNQIPNALTLLDNAAWVQRLARRLLQDAQLAEDVAQEVLAVGLTAPSSLSANPERFRRWLGGVTRRVASRMRRREGERLSWESQVARAEANESEKAALERLQLHQRLTNAVMELDEPHRSVLVMRFFDDLKPQEIARQLSLPQATVRKRLSRASALLRARLDDEFGGDQRAWCVALLALVEGPRVLAPVAGLSKVLWPVAAVAVAASALLGLELGGRVAAEPEPASVELSMEKSTSQPSIVSTAQTTSSDPASKRVEVAVPATEANFDLLVVTENGSPIADVLVCLVAGEKIVASTRTGSFGHAFFFSESDTPAQLVVQSSGRPLVVTALDEQAGTQRVILQPGTSVSGRIEVDGTTPRRPLLLKLGWSDSPLEPLSTGLREQLVEHGLHTPLEPVPTAADGSFFIDGLPADWSGTLRLPTTHWFARVPDGMELAAWNESWLTLRNPLKGLKLEATRLPLVAACVLAADTGLPLHDATVTAIPLFEGDGSGPQIGAAMDGTGCFVTGLHDGSTGPKSPFHDPALTPALLEVRLAVSAPGYQGVELTFLGSELGQNGALGNIELEPARELRFVFRDQQGRPISGAMAYGDRVSPPSDEEGFLHYRDGSEGRTSVLVGSPHHRVREISIPEWTGADAPPIEVVLEPGNRLELQLVGSREAVEGARTIKVSGSAGLYELGYGGYPTRLHAALGATVMGSSLWSEGVGYTRFNLAGKDGAPVVFLSVVAGVALNVEVLGRQRNVLLSETIVTPGPGETLRHELRIEQSPFELGVRVSDEAGAPLKGVSLKLAFGMFGGLLGPKTVSDSEGAGTFLAMYPSANPGLLSAELPGYVPLGIPDIVIAPDTQLPDLVMQPAVAVRVQVQGEDGQAVPVSTVWAKPAGCGPATSKQLEPGVFLVSGLPQQTVLLHVSYGGREFTLEHDAFEPDATFVLPNHGSLWLQLSDAVVMPEHGWLQARFTSLDEVGIEFVVYPEDSSAEEPVPLLPGRYRVQFEHHRQAKDGAPSTQDVLGQSRVVDVQAGKRLDLILDGR